VSVIGSVLAHARDQSAFTDLVNSRIWARWIAFIRRMPASCLLGRDGRGSRADQIVLAAGIAAMNVKSAQLETVSADMLAMRSSRSPRRLTTNDGKRRL